MRIQYRELLKDGQYLADPPPVGPVAKKWSYRFTEKIKPVKTLITVASMSNKGQYAILLIAALAMFMDGLDGSIVNVALPVISEDLGGDAGAVSWIVTVHLMVLAGLILIFGKISDSGALKRVFIVGSLVFALSSLVHASRIAFLFHILRNVKLN
ncbi:hypothetical protein AOA80_01890 [Methanomassiliicoccales archaeon RumEn M1]|nr:hypothetical protein AOA80_01890 [Methanomassiliicoccales archaeon RumEn M1]